MQPGNDTIYIYRQFHCFQTIAVSDKIFVQGCLKGFGTWLGRNTIIAGASSLAIMLVQACIIIIIITSLLYYNVQYYSSGKEY